MIELVAFSKKRNVQAKAIFYSLNKIVVLKGSIISPETSIFKMALDAKKYRQDKKYISNNNVLQEDLEFKSSSAAAQFVSGYSVNGFNYWKNPQGTKLGELIKKK